MSPSIQPDSSRVHLPHACLTDVRIELISFHAKCNIRQLNLVLVTVYFNAPCGPGQSPSPFFFTSPQCHFLLYLLVSFTFPLFPFLLTLSIFLLFHLFPFYQNRPTPFPRFQPGSHRRKLNLAFVFFVC